MKRRLITTLLIFTLSNTRCFANEGKNQADSFANIYSSFCLKHISNLDVIRTKLKPVPTLPPEKAAHFLLGKQGDAWPVPDKYGIFVLAIPKEKNFCAIFARRANTDEAKKLFLELVAIAPSPFVAKLVSTKSNQTSANGITQTIFYEWTYPNQKRKFLFALSTAPMEKAEIQVLGTVSMISD
jgi:hypothetical protein